MAGQGRKLRFKKNKMVPNSAVCKVSATASRCAHTVQAGRTVSHVGTATDYCAPAGYIASTTSLKNLTTLPGPFCLSLSLQLSCLKVTGCLESMLSAGANSTKGKRKKKHDKLQPQN